MATASHCNEGSAKYIDARCFPCTDNNKDQTADHYCYDCEKHMCKACLGIHNSLIQNHAVVQGNRGDESELTEKCEEHKKELITLFCLQHKELMCIQCRRQDHRTCKDVKHIQETARQLSAVTDLKDVTAQLQSALSNVQKSIEALDNDVASIQNMGSVFLKELEDYAEKLLSLIKELREKGQGDIKSKEDQLVADSQRYRQGCVLAKDEGNRCLDAISKPNQLKANLFILKTKAQTITKQVYALQDQSESWIEGRQFKFTADRKIMNSLNSYHSLFIDVSTKVVDMTSLGTVGGAVDSPMQEAAGRIGNSRESREKRGGSPVEVPVNKRKRVDETVKRPGEKPSGGKAPYIKRQVKNINVRIPVDEYKCDIIGCSCLSDGYLLLADCGNNRLKRLDPSSGTVTKYCDTEGKPRDICCIGPQEVAVTFPGSFLHSTQVHVYNTESLTRTRTVELGHETSRIACNGLLLYCAKWPDTLLDDILYVYDVSSGNKLREISKDTDGRQLFSKIYGIAVNSSGDRVYVADAVRGLVCVGVTRRRIFHLSLKDLGLSYATGVTTDHHGHVFVCGLGSQNVVKVTVDGHVVGQTLSEEDEITWGPSCLSYDVNKSRLYVGGESDQLLVVEWK